MASTAQNMTNSVTDSSSQSRDLKDEIVGAKTISEVVTIFENENSSKNDSEHSAKSISRTEVESSTSTPVDVPRNQILSPCDVIMTIDEESKETNTIKSSKTGKTLLTTHR